MPEKAMIERVGGRLDSDFIPLDHPEDVTLQVLTPLFATRRRDY